jgi:superfamily II DNA helicase RecQ
MRGTEKIALELPERTAGALNRRQTGSSSTASRNSSQGGGILDRRLYGLLVGQRAKMAATSGKPAFTVLSNAVLVELANKKPTNQSEALEIKGIGPAKLNSVLPEFLQIIKQNS